MGLSKVVSCRREISRPSFWKMSSWWEPSPIFSSWTLVRSEPSTFLHLGHVIKARMSFLLLRLSSTLFRYTKPRFLGMSKVKRVVPSLPACSSTSNLKSSHLYNSQFRLLLHVTHRWIGSIHDVVTLLGRGDQGTYSWRVQPGPLVSSLR